MTWFGYVDESESNPKLDPDVYILAASIVHEDSLEHVRDVMRGLRAKGERKLHWYHESAKRRQWIASSLADLDVLHTVVVRTGLPGERPEKRRRKCLERPLVELFEAGIHHVCVEGRQRHQDDMDRVLLATMRACKLVSAEHRMDHMEAPAEPLLWLADVAAGAIVADRLGVSDFLTEIKYLVEIHTLVP